MVLGFVCVLCYKGPTTAEPQPECQEGPLRDGPHGCLFPKPFPLLGCRRLPSEWPPGFDGFRHGSTMPKAKFKSEHRFMRGTRERQILRVLFRKSWLSSTLLMSVFWDAQFGTHALLSFCCNILIAATYHNSANVFLLEKLAIKALVASDSLEWLKASARILQAFARVSEGLFSCRVGSRFRWWWCWCAVIPVVVVVVATG